MESKIDWKKHFKHQETDAYCGNAVVQMILDTMGIQKTQQDIARAIYKSWWGVSADLMYGYLSKYFNIIDYKDYVSIYDLFYYLNKNYIVIVHIDKCHYCIVVNYDENIITIVDPYEIKKGVKDIDIEDFKKRWYTTIKVNNTTYDGGWMLWIDPESKR